MGQYTNVLEQLAQELLSSTQLNALCALLSASLVEYDSLLKLDEDLGGPSMSRLTCRGSGRYEVTDREVFRPLQYCYMHFVVGSRNGRLEWYARDIVKDSGLHIESLVQRIGQLKGITLGRAIHNSLVRQRLGQDNWRRVDTFRVINNAAKHDVSHPKDTHLFSVSDAVLAYLISRKLGIILYPVANLATDTNVFQQPCQ